MESGSITLLGLGSQQAVRRVTMLGRHLWRRVRGIDRGESVCVYMRTLKNVYGVCSVRGVCVCVCVCV
jgi:hypothetical protein